MHLIWIPKYPKKMLTGQVALRVRLLLQEFAHLRKAFWGRHLWARGYLVVSPGSRTDELVRDYIEQQEGEPLHDESRFVIDTPPKLPPSRR